MRGISIRLLQRYQGSNLGGVGNKRRLSSKSDL